MWEIGVECRVSLGLSVQGLGFRVSLAWIDYRGFVLGAPGDSESL